MSDFNVSSIASAVMTRNNEHVPTVADLPFDMNFETGKHFQRQSFTVFASTDRSQGVLRLHQIQSRHTLGLEKTASISASTAFIGPHTRKTTHLVQMPPYDQRGA